MAISDLFNRSRQQLAACQSLARRQLRNRVTTMSQQLNGSRRLAMAAIGVPDRTLGFELAVSLQQVFQHVSLSRTSTGLINSVSDAILGESPKLDLIVASAKLWPRGGLDLLASLRDAGWNVPFVLIVDEHNELADTAATNFGALLIEPPIDAASFRELVTLMCRKLDPEPEEVSELQKTAPSRPGSDDTDLAALDRSPSIMDLESVERPSQWEITLCDDTIGLHRDERRFNDRAPFKATAFTFHKAEWRAFTSLDVSRGGVGLRCSDSLDEGALVSQMLIPTVQNGVIFALSEVVHVTEQPSAFSVGLKFVELDASGRRCLDGLLRLPLPTR